MRQMLIITVLFLASPATALAGEVPVLDDAGIAFEEFTQWPIATQKGYWREIREAWTEFEKAGPPFASIKGHGWSDAVAAWLEPAAHAANAPSCPVGGWEREMVKNQKGQWRCPTTGKPCGERGEKGFQCAPIYNEACVSRLPIESLTERCDRAAGDVLPSKATYDSVSSMLGGVAERCRGKQYERRFQTVCERMVTRIDNARSKYGLQAGAESESAAGEPLTPIPQPSPQACFPPVGLKIKRNYGGRVDAFMARARQLRASGKALEISGPCASACILYAALLPRERVCLGPDAKLGFHDWALDYGPGQPPVPDRRYTDRMTRRLYPPELVAFWEKHKDDSPDPLAMKWMRGPALSAVYQSCADAKGRASCASAPGGPAGASPAVNR